MKHDGIIIYIYIKEIKVKGSVSFNKYTNLIGLFANCINCTTVDISGLIIDNTINIAYLFDNTSRLTKFTVPKQLNANIKEYLGYRLLHWTDNNGNTISKADDIIAGTTYTEHGTIALTFGTCDCTLIRINTDNWTLIIGEGVGKVEVKLIDSYNTYITYPWYWKSGVLTSINITGKVSFENNSILDVMFANCSQLRELDLSNFDTSNVKYMNNMFYNCSSLTSLDVSSFDTSNVKYMNNMFYNCSSLTSLDVSSFDTSNVTNMTSMFYNCSSLTSLDVSSFDTSKVEFIGGMFDNCSSLTSLDVSSFDTSNVMNMGEMFYNCSSLTSLDVSSFDTSNVMYMGGMFYNCSSLKSIKLNDITMNNYIGLN